MSNKTKSPSTTSVIDEVVLEYRVNNLWHELRDLQLRKESLKNEVADLRAQVHNVQNQLRTKQSENEKIIRGRIDTILHDKELIFSISFFALTEALRNHPDIKLLLFDLIMNEGVVGDVTNELKEKSIIKNLENNQFLISYY